LKKRFYDETRQGLPDGIAETFYLSSETRIFSGSLVLAL
jgi:hypothetical protein